MAPGDAIAAPLYTASVGYPNGVDQTLTKQDATTAEASLSSSVPTSGSGSDTHNQFAAASSAGLRASARTTISATSDPGEFFGGEASSYGLAAASMEFDDLHVTSGSGSVSGSLNVHLSGTFLVNNSAFADLGDPGSGGHAAAGSSVVVTVGVYLTENFFPFQTQGQLIQFQQSADTDGNMTGSLFDSQTITTQTFTFPNRFGAYKLKILLQTNSFASIGAQAKNVYLFSDALSDFSHTLTLPSSGPVFNLPDGITINSPEAQIVNNAFVPEPGATGLLACAVCVIEFPIRRRRTTEDRTD